MIRAIHHSLRAEFARTNDFELVAFHLPPGRGGIAEHIGREIFGGHGYATRITGGACRTFNQAKRETELAFAKLSRSL